MHTISAGTEGKKATTNSSDEKAINTTKELKTGKKPAGGSSRDSKNEKLQIVTVSDKDGNALFNDNVPYAPPWYGGERRRADYSSRADH